MNKSVFTAAGAAAWAVASCLALPVALLAARAAFPWARDHWGLSCTAGVAVGLVAMDVPRVLRKLARRGPGRDAGLPWGTVAALFTAPPLWLMYGPGRAWSSGSLYAAAVAYVVLLAAVCCAVHLGLRRRPR